jgi:hypothetical protein
MGGGCEDRGRSCAFRLRSWRGRCRRYRCRGTWQLAPVKVTLDIKSSSRKSGFLGSTKENASGHLETTTAVGSSVSGKGGATIISGGDTTVSASKVTAGDDTHTADLNVQTGGNLIVTAGKDTETEHDSANRKGFLRSGSSSYDGYNETTIGSQLSASGDVNLDAGKAAAIVGSKVNADGSLNISGESVSIIGAQENHQSDSQRKDSGLSSAPAVASFRSTARTRNRASNPRLTMSARHYLPVRMLT